ncbi:MAG: efflux RND transporter periplasmic adaptor subunit [Firmicutes bacterium]|nr:efflux RND transporter periplasmic adaptor subunit [Bacillota bacterium]
MDSFDYVNNEKNRKRKILKIAKVFLIVIIFLTFSSKSIHNMTLAKVKVDYVSSGNLTKEIIKEGIVRPKESIEYYIDLNAVVKDLMVNVGDHVKKGDVLLVLDNKKFKQELQKRKLELKELRIQNDKLLLEVDNKYLHNYELKVKECRENMLQKKRSFITYKKLFEEGAKSKNEFNEKYNDYKLEKLKYENAVKELKLQKEKVNKQMKRIKKDIEAKKINISKKELEIKEIEDKINKSTIRALANGTIKELNFKKGMVINNSKAVYKLDTLDKGFNFKAQLANEKCSYIEIGDNVKVVIKNSSGDIIKGKVKAITNNKIPNKKTIIIDLGKKELSGEEVGTLFVRKEIDSYKYIIPRSSLYEDNKGKYIFVLNEKKGPLGKEYFVTKKTITIGDSDNRYIGVNSGLTGEEKIVIRSDKDLYDGSEVFLEN